MKIFRFKDVGGDDEQESRRIWKRLTKLEQKQEELQERLAAVELKSGIYQRPSGG